MSVEEEEDEEEGLEFDEEEDPASLCFGFFIGTTVSASAGALTKNDAVPVEEKASAADGSKDTAFFFFVEAFGEGTIGSATGSASSLLSSSELDPYPARRSMLM
jgi:hypothetical protein